LPDVFRAFFDKIISGRLIVRVVSGTKMAANLINKASLREIKQDLQLFAEKCLARGLVHNAKW
jgi:hypothetical protein